MVKYIPPLGHTTFIEHTDTPDSYSGQAGNLPYVKSTEDGLEFLAQKAVGFRSRVRVYLSADFNIASSTSTTVPFDMKSYDELNEFDTTSHRFTASESGWYVVIASLKFSSVVDAHMISGYLLKNGGLILCKDMGTSGTTPQGVDINDIVYLAAGDYLDFSVFHDFGITASLEGTEEDKTFAAIHRIS